MILSGANVLSARNRILFLTEFFVRNVQGRNISIIQLKNAWIVLWGSSLIPKLCNVSVLKANLLKLKHNAYRAISQNISTRQRNNVFHARKTNIIVLKLVNVYIVRKILQF